MGEDEYEAKEQEPESMQASLQGIHSNIDQLWTPRDIAAPFIKQSPKEGKRYSSEDRA